MSPFFPVTGNSHPFLVFIADKNIAFEPNVSFLFQEPKISSFVKGDYEKNIAHLLREHKVGIQVS